MIAMSGERDRPMGTADRRTVLRSLPTFCAVAETGQVRLAAAELGEQQSVVSRTLARLQRTLGVDLFERRGRGIALTEAGRRFLPFAQESLRQLDAGLGELEDHGVIGADTLRLAFQSLLGLRLVPSLITRFRAAFPDVCFELTQGSRQRGLQLLEDGAVDIALLSSPPRMARTTTIELSTEPLVALVRAGHPLERAARAGSPAGERATGVSVHRLADEELILHTPEFDVHQLVTDMFASVGRTPRIGLTAEDYYTVRGLVEAGLGVSVMPPMPTIQDQVRELRIDSPMARRTIGAVVHEDAGRPALTEFVRMLETSGGQSAGS
jgi:DNA-binding transcriptional LysR family regulator